MNVLGIDEAGRGSVLGPLVIAGVMAEEDYFEENEFPDSKKLDKKSRSELFEKINEETRAYFIKISPETIDETENLNFLEWRIMDAIMLAFSFDKANVDAVGNTDEQKNYFIDNSPLMNEDINVESDADDLYNSVGSASIIAKEVRDRHIRELSVDYGEIGSGYPSDQNTRQWLENNIDNLPEFVRKSWSTIDKIKG